MSKSVDMHWDTAALSALKLQAKQGLVMTANDIETKAKRKAPFREGHLTASITKREVGQWTVEITAGNSMVPYALYQERGYGIKHYTTPGTGKNYMANSLKEVLAGDFWANFRRAVK